MFVLKAALNALVFQQILPLLKGITSLLKVVIRILTPHSALLTAPAHFVHKLYPFAFNSLFSIFPYTARYAAWYSLAPILQPHKCT